MKLKVCMEIKKNTNNEMQYGRETRMEKNK